ncbi:MAG: FtsX-like permease family protein, partial [Planctomycetota bacterium]|nr:FtsX-like permease family protein [Planctomycetota bacterium]
DGAWIGAGLARELGALRGSTFVLDVRARAVPIRVLGVLDESRGPAFARLVLVDVARAQEIVGEPGRLDRIEIVPRVATDLVGLAERVRALLPRGAVVTEPERRGAEARGLVRSLEFNLTALSGISLLVGAVLVATTLATSVVQRARTIALLRSLGASAGQIRGAILVEAATIGALGGVLGSVLGFVGARALLPQMRATVATVVPTSPESPIRFAWDHVLVGVGLGVGVALLAAWLPVVESARTPPIQSLRGEAPSRLRPAERRIALGIAAFFALLASELVQLPAWRGLPVAALLASVSVLGVLFAGLGPAVDALGALASRVRALPSPIRLACAALSAGRRRAAWAAGAVGVAVTLSISMAAMVYSFRETVIEWSDRSLRADFTIRPLTSRDGLPVGRMDPDVLDAAAAVVGRGALDPYHAAEALHTGEKITVTGADLGLVARRGGPRLVDGSDPGAAIARAKQRRGALVNEAFARRFDVAQGSRIQIEVAGFPLQRTVEGVFRDYGDSRGVVTIDLDDFLAYFPGDAPLQIGVHMPDGADLQAARADLESALGVRFQLEVLSNSEIKRQVLAVFDRTFAITTALQGVAGLVAVIAVLSVLYALVAERRADLALLSAIGAGRWQVGGVVVGQAAILGLLGAGAGAIAGLVVGVIIVSVVNVQSFGWTIDFHQPWSVVFTTIAGVVAACAVSGLLPAHATDPRRLAGALREE